MKMFLRIAVGLVGLIVVALGVGQLSRGASPQELGGTYTSKQNGYSFRIPKGWETESGSQPGTMMISAPNESEVNSNMIIAIEQFNGSLTDYVEASKEALRRNAPKAKILSNTAYATDAKVTARKVKMQNKSNDEDLAQTMYFFDGPEGRKVIVICTTSAKSDGQLEPLFDNCMKTFAFAAP